MKLERAIEKGAVGGAVNFTVEGTEVITYTPVTILTKLENENNRFTVMVSSSLPQGKTIVINIEKAILPVTKPEELIVMVDGKRIGLADDLSDVLEPSDENVPEYLVLIGNKGVQILVSIPSFSTRTIMITKGEEPAMVQAPPRSGEREFAIHPLLVMAIAIAFIAISIAFGRKLHRHS